MSDPMFSNSNYTEYIEAYRCGYDSLHAPVGVSHVYEGEVDNGSFGDSTIYIGPEFLGSRRKRYSADPDLDEVFKSLDGYRVRVTIEVIERAFASSDGGGYNAG